MAAADDAKVRLRCPKCGRSGSVPAWTLGADKRLNCPGCGSRLTASMVEGQASPGPSRTMSLDEAEEFAAGIVGELVPVAMPPPMPMPAAQPATPPPLPMVPVDVAQPARLLACPDCGGPVSRSAPGCPRCGRPMATRPAPQPQPQQAPTVVQQVYVGAPPASGGSGCLVTLGALSLIGGLVFLLLLPPLGVLMILVGLALVVLGKIV